MGFMEDYRKTGELLKRHAAPGMRAWFKADMEWWETATPEQKAERRARMDARAEEDRKMTEWLDWCAKNNTHPKSAL